MDGFLGLAPVATPAPPNPQLQLPVVPPPAVIQPQVPLPPEIEWQNEVNQQQLMDTGVGTIADGAPSTSKKTEGPESPK